ncbi:hypothetical protein F2Q69_00063527 [Brassica cretica]|uniref:Uncharacterized protein n=1 Tax=Brassica cretica TaxID=69181 RepID=A0A8S9RDH0_BRACR|nr:hypothetical protein F2Q69_00063527 [Brassica cretica]
MDTRQAEAQLASSGENKRDRSEGRKERRLSDEAERSADQRNWENPNEEPPSTPKKGDTETKTGRPSPEKKARMPEAEPVDHQENARLRKHGPVGESKTGERKSFISSLSL